MANPPARAHRAETRRLHSLALEAHNHLHAGQIGAAHESLHKALLCEEEGAVDPAAARVALGLSFDEEFRALLAKHQRRAIYVSLVVVDEARREVSIQSGGDGPMCQQIGPYLRMWARTAGESAQ